jgi:hypothetical protein
MNISIETAKLLISLANLLIYYLLFPINNTRTFCARHKAKPLTDMSELEVLVLPQVGQTFREGGEIVTTEFTVYVPIMPDSQAPQLNTENGIAGHRKPRRPSCRSTSRHTAWGPLETEAT